MQKLMLRNDINVKVEQALFPPYAIQIWELQFYILLVYAHITMGVDLEKKGFKGWRTQEYHKQK